MSFSYKTVRIDEATYERLKEIAEEEDRPITKIIKRLVIACGDRGTEPTNDIKEKPKDEATIREEQKKHYDALYAGLLANIQETAMAQPMQPSQIIGDTSLEELDAIYKKAKSKPFKGMGHEGLLTNEEIEALGDKNIFESGTMESTE